MVLTGEGWNGISMGVDRAVPCVDADWASTAVSTSFLRNPRKPRAELYTLSTDAVSVLSTRWQQFHIFPLVSISTVLCYN